MAVGSGNNPGPLGEGRGGVKKEAKKEAGTQGPAATNKKKERRNSSSEGRACSGIGQVDVSASVGVRPSAESHSGVRT